jgi:hypothetical protein
LHSIPLIEQFKYFDIFFHRALPCAAHPALVAPIHPEKAFSGDKIEKINIFSRKTDQNQD